MRINGSKCFAFKIPLLEGLCEGVDENFSNRDILNELMRKSLFVIFVLMMSLRPLFAGEKPLCIAALGDSTTAGTPGFRSPVEAPPRGAGNEKSQYTYWIGQKHTDWNILNRGVNGERTDQIFQRIERDVIGEGADIAIVLAGVNDLYQGFSAEMVKTGLARIYAALKEAGVRVVACTILPYNTAGDDVNGRMLEVNSWIAEYARGEGFGFCDTHSLAADPRRPGKLAGTPDGLHPDIATYRRMGQEISRSLEDLLQPADKKP